MPREQDTLFADIAIQMKLLTSQQLAEARANHEDMKRMGIEQSLGAILYGKQLLTKSQVQEVKAEVAKRTGAAHTIGQYEVLAELGRGGMGVVYKARAKRDGQTVAIKVLPPNADENLVQRFQRECKIASGLNHPNMVRCLDTGFDPRRKLHYCVLEFVKGKTLTRKVADKGTLSEVEALTVCALVAEALRHAHGAGLIHRDVKPDNIIFTPDHKVKLLDLGLARPVDSDATKLTQTGTFVGTAHFASPEQARGKKDIDARSDIYSLGATLFFMLTGLPPYDGDTTLEVLQQVLSSPPPDPRDFNPSLEDSTVSIMRKAMEKRPEDRFQTSQEFHTRLSHNLLWYEQTMMAVDFESEDSANGTQSLLGCDAIAEPQANSGHENMKVPTTGAFLTLNRVNRMWSHLRNAYRWIGTHAYHTLGALLLCYMLMVAVAHTFYPDAIEHFSHLPGELPREYDDSTFVYAAVVAERLKYYFLLAIAAIAALVALNRNTRRPE